MKQVVLFLASALAQLCTIDQDCWSKSRPDIHSEYCVNSRCQRILPPGAHCSKPTDCASYFYFGSLACGSKCTAENECEGLQTKDVTSKYCCRPVPEERECMPSRPNMLNGCSLRHSCAMGTHGEFRCSSGSIHSWIYGVMLSISGNLFINVGINVQKKSYTTSHFEMFGVSVGNFALGVFVYALGKVLSFTAYIYGNQSLLASLSAFGLIANSVFAPLINQEVFTWKDFMAILLVLLGSSVIMMNAGRTGRVFSVCELLKMYRSAGSLMWFSFLVALIVALYVAIKYVEMNSEWGTHEGFFRILRRNNVFFEDNGVVLKYFMLIFYVGLSASIAAFTSLFAKSFGEMVEKTILGDNQFLFGVTYMFFVLLVSFTFWQIYWLNRALRHYDALLTLPMFHAMWTVLSIFNAGIYFLDFEHFTHKQVGGFVLGLGVILVGSLFLASRVHDRDKLEATKAELNITTSKKDE